MNDFKTNKAYLFQYRKKMEKIQRLEDKLAQIVVVALAFVGTAIMVAIVAHLMDGE